MVLRVYVVPTWCARMCSECEDVFSGKVQASDAARRGLFSVSLNVAIKGFCLEARNVIMQRTHVLFRLRSRSCLANCGLPIEC